MAEAKKHRRGRRGKHKGNWFANLSKGKKIAVCIGGVVLCIFVAGIIYVAAALNKIDTEDISAEDIAVNEEAELAGEGYTNVALFGIDSRSGELEQGTRSDCLIVASLNNETKEVRMVSVYRDTVLDIEDGYLQKCNAAYAFGGPTQAINMINKNLDLNIQDYATVDFAAVATAIDLLGGIEIDVKPEEIKTLNKYVKETARVAGKTAKKVSSPGLQLLDGVQATTYARIRSTAGGDFTRTERQRLVIEKIVEKAQQTDLATINNIINEVFPTIKTSFSVSEILSYAKDFMKYKIGESDGFPFEKTTATISGLGSIVIPVTLAENVSQLHEFLYDTVDYSPSATVSSINDSIIARVGQRTPTDYSTLSNKTYVDTEEDKAQEKNKYPEPPKKQETEKPATSGTTTKPDKDSTTTKPDKDSTAKPDKDSATTKPNKDNTTTKPDTGGSTTKPDTGGETTKPDAGGETPAPDTGGETPAPDTGGETPAPDTGGEAPAPDTGGGDGGSAPENSDASASE